MDPTPNVPAAASDGVVVIHSVVVVRCVERATSSVKRRHGRLPLLHSSTTDWKGSGAQLKSIGTGIGLSTASDFLYVV